MSTQPMTQAAEYARLGWSVIPVHSIKDGACTCKNPNCKSPGKHPVLNNWTSKASNDDYQIAKWMSQYKSKNIGVVTGKKSNLVVLDLDLKHNGLKGWQAIEKRHGKSISDTLCAITGSGGRHYYYQIDDTTEIKNSQQKIATGIDVRANGGFVVGANSIHQSGNRYQWSDGLYQPAPLPDSLLTELQSLNTSLPQTPDKLIKQGKRNDELFRYAASLRRQGFEHDDILAQIMQRNVQQCEIPLSVDELHLIADSVTRYSKGANGLKNLFARSVMQSRELSGYARLALYTLSNHADAKTLTAFPSQKLLADESGISRETVSLKLKEAESLGFVEITKKPRKGKTGYQHFYRLILRSC